LYFIFNVQLTTYGEEIADKDSNYIKTVVLEYFNISTHQMKIK